MNNHKQFKVLLTEAQNEARVKLMNTLEIRSSDFIRDMLALACMQHGIDWPDDMEQPGGDRSSDWVQEAEDLESLMDIDEALGED